MDVMTRAPARVGRIRTVRQALACWRPVSYTSVANFLKDYNLHQFVVDLWKELWDEPLPNVGDNGWLNNVEVAQSVLMNRVNEEFFPVDLAWFDALYEDWLNGAYEDDEDEEGRPASFHPILYALQIEEQGFDWPWGWSLADTDAGWAEPLAHALALHDFEHRNEVSAETRQTLRREARKWWKAHGFRRPPTLPWLDAPGTVIVRHLEALPFPFDGLATVYHLLTHKSGNPFLDNGPEDAWAAPWGWTREDILYLAKQHLASLPFLERRDALRDWFDAQADKEEATRQIIQMLVAPPLSVTLGMAEEHV